MANSTGNCCAKIYALCNPGFDKISLPVEKVNIILNKQKAPFSIGERSSIST